MRAGAASAAYCRAIIILAAASVAILTVAAPCSGREEPSRLRRWNRGHELLDRGAPGEAADLFIDALERDPGDLLAAEGLLESRFRQRRINRGLAEAAAIPGSGSVVLRSFTRAESLRARWRLPQAAAAYGRAAELAAGRGDSLSLAMARLQHGRSLAREGRLEEARAAGASGRAMVAGGEGAGGARLSAAFAILDADRANLEGRYGEADSLYRATLAEARGAGWRRHAYECLNGLGRTSSRRRLTSTAAAYGRQAVALAERMNDPFRIAQSLTNLAYDEGVMHEAGKARAHLERARALAQGGDFIGLLGFIHASLGSLAEAAGDRPAAAASFRRAIAFHLRAGSGAGALGARQRLAYALLMLGEYRQAIAHYDTCLQLGESLDSPVGGNWVLGGLALAWHKLGRLDRAAEYYRRSLEVDERLGDRTSAAWALNSLGLLHAMGGDYRQALLHQHRALAIAEELGDAEGAGSARVSIAEVRTRLGDYDRAFKEAAAAFAIAQAGGHEELLRSAVTALAAVCEATGRQEAAGTYLEQALDVARRWRDREAIVWALGNLAEHRLAEGRSDAARAHLAEAAGLLEPAGQYDLRARVLMLQARCARTPAAAVVLGERAWEAARTGALPDREWQCLSDLGLHCRDVGDSTRAWQCQRRAMEVVESLRRQAGADELRRHMLRPAIVPYERAVDLLLTRAPGESAVGEALLCAERSRARILAERLRSAPVAPDSSGGAPARPDLEDLVSRIGYLQARLQDGALPQEERSELRARIDTLEQRQALLALDDSGRTGRSDVIAPADLRLEEMTGALRPGERALSYFLGTDRSWLISVSARGLSAHPLPRRDEIERQVRVFLRLWHDAVSAGAQASGGVPAAVLDEARRGLHDLLLGPVAGELSTGEALVIVPDGLLHRLPFAQLRDDRGYLLERHELFVAPSLQTLAFLRRREADRCLAGRPRLDIVAVGCDGAGASATPRVLPFTGAPMPPLPDAEAEARRAASRFRAALVLIGADADERSFKASPLGDCAILHLAAHGQADDADVRRSFIVLNPERGPARDGGEDGLLQWHEAAALPLRASLVTLASCRSADGVLAVGEGVTGLTQAFLHAGATCVLAAVSDVPDRLSARLSERFYRGVRRGMPAATALRAAQLAALKEPDPGGACAWAGFMLVGDGGATVVGSAGGGQGGRLLALAVIGGMAGILAVGCVILRRRESKR